MACHEVVVNEVQPQSGFVVFQLPAKAVAQPCKPLTTHADTQIAAFDMRRAQLPTLNRTLPLAVLAVLAWPNAVK